MWDLRQPACRRVDPLRNQKSPNYVRGDCHLFHRPPVKMPRIPCGFPVRSEEHTFEVCDPVISGDRLSSMGRSTAGHGHPRVVLIAGECNHKCNHRGRAGRDAIACRCANDRGAACLIARPTGS
jgi:hypothetical protein